MPSQGLGDIFAIRVAGNTFGDGTAASLVYAVAHLNVKLIVVLGHEACGAVRDAAASSDARRATAAAADADAADASADASEEEASGSDDDEEDGGSKRARRQLRPPKSERLEDHFARMRRGLVRQQPTFRSIRDGRARDREAVVSNIFEQMRRVTDDAFFASRVEDRSLLVVGAFYEICRA